MVDPGKGLGYLKFFGAPEAANASKPRCKLPKYDNGSTKEEIRHTQQKEQHNPLISGGYMIDITFVFIPLVTSLPQKTELQR